MTTTSALRNCKVVVPLLPLFFLFSSLLLAQSPTITSIAPSTGAVGMQVQIVGSGFGATQGTSSISLHGTNAVATAWSDGSIFALVPSGATSGPFAVTVGTSTAQSASFTVTPMPSGWSDSDIGTVGTAGSAVYASGAFTVSGSGNQIYGTADAFHFAYQALSGDGSIVARLVSIQGTNNSNETVGVMIRETLNAGSTNAKFSHWPSWHAAYFDYRSTTGGSTSEPGSQSMTLPYWIKVVRSGSSFTSYGSSDGVNWTQVGSSQTINMVQNVYIGLAVNSGTSSLVSATFDNISVSSTANPAPVITGVSATTGNVGSQVVISGSNFGVTQGGMVMLNAVPMTINAWSNTSITATVPSNATTGAMMVLAPPSMNDSNKVWFTVTPNPLPQGWLDGDIGTVGTLGTATYANGAFTVSGAGSQIYGSADSFHFAYVQLSGDSSIVARVASVQGMVGFYGAAAVMIRETLSTGATNATTADWPKAGSGYFTFTYRPTTNGSAAQGGTTTKTPPYWVKVVRSGNSFSGYASLDGVNWAQVGSTTTISMAQSVYVGLGVTSGSTSSLATATFDNVSIGSSTVPAPAISAVSATTGPASSQLSITGSGFGASQGSSGVLLNDVPATINSWSDTSLTVTLPASASTGPLVVVVGPSMIASNPIVFTVTSQPLPTYWLDSDVGSVGTAGSATYSNGTFTVKGAGSQIYSNTDQFHFAYLPVSGNGALVARLASTQGISGFYGAAGVMIRETLSSGATNATVADWPPSAGYFTFTYRSTTNGSSNQNSTTSKTPPYWLKVVRSGNTFTAYTSSDGVNWTQLGSAVTISMAQNVYVGLCVESGSTSSLGTATFDNVSSTFAVQVPAPSITSLSPTTAVPLASVTISGTNFGTTQGSSTVTFNGTAASPTSWNANSIVTPVPLGATSGNVVVTVQGFASNGVPFTVSQTPTINGISPTSGPVGTSVTISGVNFGSTQGTSTVKFNGTVATPTSWTATSIVVPVPSGATTGNVVVTTSNGSSTAGPFTVFQVPSITSLSTSSATIGSLVTITGTNFGSSQGTSSVTFNGVAGVPTSWTSTSIAVPVPVGATTGSVIVTVNGLPSNAAPLTVTLVSLPSVARVLPANGATGVPENTRVIVRFAQPVQVAAVIPGTVSVSQGTTSIAGTLALSSDGLSVTFTPTQNLSANASLSVAVTDLAGNQTTPEFQSAFTTGSTTDTVAPTVVQTNPASSATNVPISAPIIAQFSKAIDPTTLNSQNFTVSDGTTAKPLVGTVQVDASGVTGSFIPQTLLGVGRTFSVSLYSSVKDTSGNSLSSTSFSFTTGFATDTSGPQLLGVSPANGTSGIPLNALIVLEFSKPLDTISVPLGLQVTSGGQTVAGAIALSNSNQQITFTPLGGMAPATTYTISTTADLTDVGGLPLSNPGTLSFTSGSTSDSTTPSVVGVNPPNSSTGVPLNPVVQLQFSKPVDPLTVTPANLQLMTYISGIAFPQGGTVSVSADGLTAMFVPSALLNAYTTYSVQPTSGISDTEGHALTYSYSSFTTGSATQSSSPTVQIVSPASGITGVPVNVRVDVVVSSPLDPASVSASTVVVSTGGISVPGSVTLSSDGMTLTYTPSGLLSANTTYGISVSGATDQAGNAIVPFSSSFTTASSSSANSTKPSVLSTNPASGATGVSVNAPIVLTFNEPVDQTTINDVTTPISVSGLNGALSGMYSMDSTGTVVTFTPSSPLPANATITVQVTSGGVLDLSGNSSNAYSGTFSTSSGTDSIPPSVLMVTPANASSGVSVNTPVVLTFSKSLNPNTINTNTFGLLVNGTSTSMTISRSADNRVVTLNPHGLPAFSTITVLVTSGVTDLYGNPLGDFQIEFTTGAAASATLPTIVGQRPGSGATAVPVNDSIVLYFSQPMNASSLTGALNVSQNGVLLSGTTQVTGNGQVLQFTPSAALQTNSLVQVFLASTAQNASGISINSYQSSFTTVADMSTAVPVQTGSSPTNSSTAPTNAVIDMAFNVPLDPATLGPTAVLCYQNGAWLQGEVSLVDGGTVVQVVPRSPLTPNVSVNCTVGTSVQGLNGVATYGASVGFTPGSGPDTVIPTIVTLSPPNNSVIVGDNAAIRVVFSKPVNPLTVNSSTIQISGGGTTVVPDSISFTNNNQMVQLVPHAPLPDGTRMTITISGITDIAGNPVAPQTTYFTTATGPDTVAPILLWASPLQTDAYHTPTNVPLNAIVQLQVNEAVDPETVNSTSFPVEDTTVANAPLPGTYSVSTDGQTLTFIPASPFTPGHQISVYSTSGGITDLAGNGLNHAAGNVMGNFTFTTGSGSNTDAPQVTALSPSNGASSIPINARVAIGFNEPIDTAKLSGVTLSGPGGPLSYTPVPSNGNQTVTLIPVTSLAANAQYTLNVSGIQDLSGNVIAAPVTSAFTTGNSADLIGPTVQVTAPVNNATGVSTTASIQVQFSKPINPLTVIPGTFYAYPYYTNVLVSGSISISADNRTATFTPNEPLDSQTYYEIDLTSGITDMEGQSLSGTARFFFTTGQGTTTLPPVIAALSPSNAGVGTSVNIKGSYFGTSQGSSTVTFNGVQATPTSWSDAQIVAPVPSGAATGPVVVTVSGNASNGVMFTVPMTPSITNVSPTSATVGTVLTITGNNFGDSQDATLVTFSSSAYPFYVTVAPISWTETSLTVAVPSTAATGNVYVAVGPTGSNALSFTVIPTPQVTSLTVSSGVAGTSVGINGANFGNSQGSSTVSFHGVPASVTSWSSNYIAAVAPSNVTTGPVTVTENSISSNSNVVFTVSGPAIGALSPPAAAIGATVKLTGSGLTSQGLTTQVLFNGVAATIFSSSSTTLTVNVPSNAASGNVTVQVGNVFSNSMPFTVEQPPTVIGLSSNEGPFASDGSTPTITIIGSGFGATQSNSTVYFYGSSTPPTIQSWSDTAITLSVTDDATSGPVTVQVGSLNASTATPFNVNQITRLTDSLGNQSQYTFSVQGGEWFPQNSSGPGCSTCSARGSVTNVPDAYGNIQTSTDDLGNTTTYTHDGNNNVTSVSQPLNVSTTATTSYTYNGFNEVLTMTDPLGNVTTNTYDAHGNLLTVTTPRPNSNTSASVTTFAYDTKGELTQITDPLNHVTTLTYNSAGLIASITDAQNHTTNYQYDARGNRTAVIDPINGSAHPTSFAYDIMNRLTGIAYPDGSAVSLGYDSRGRRTSVTDQNNRTTTYTYDDADRLTAVTDPANHTTQYAYDTEGNLLSITDANNHTTLFAYNARGWVTQTTFPSTLQESYGYDLVGNLTSKTDRKNQTIQYVYDALYRLTSKSYPDQTSVEYAYDLAGKVQQVSDPTGTYSFAYDNMGRLIGTTTQYAWLSGLNFQNAYAYDAASNRTSLTAPDGSVTAYGYDTLNRLNGLANSWAGSFGFGYDALSRRTTLTRPNGVNTSYSYDSVSHLLSVLHQAGVNTLDGASYTYDAAGNRTSKTNYLNGVTSNYGYDLIYQLTQVTQGGSTTESYNYDAVGNRLSSLGVPNYNYNSSNELTSSSNGSYAYDANGNTLTDAQGRTFTWDFENRLVQAANPGVGTTTFKYDPFGRRIQKSGPLGTTNYVYDITDVVGELDGTGAVLAKYTLGPSIDETLAELRSGATSYHQADGVGSITSLTTTSATTAASYTYDAFGNLSASTGSVTNPFHYTGREYDTETGVSYYRARYYDQQSGRFVSEDPIRFSGGNNFYAYVWNDPVSYIDPLGLCPPAPKPPFIAYPPVKPCDTSGSRDHGYPAEDIRTGHQYGVPIYATEDGIIGNEFSGGSNSPYPGPPAPSNSTDYVTLRGWSGNYVKYVHVTPALQPGSIVHAGDIIGYNDNTGRQSGPHVHMEINNNGHKIDPSTYLQFSCSASY